MANQNVKTCVGRQSVPAHVRLMDEDCCVAQRTLKSTRTGKPIAHGSPRHTAGLNSVSNKMLDTNSVTFWLGDLYSDRDCVAFPVNLDVSIESASGKKSLLTLHDGVIDCGQAFERERRLICFNHLHVRRADFKLLLRGLAGCKDGRRDSRYRVSDWRTQAESEELGTLLEFVALWRGGGLRQGWKRCLETQRPGPAVVGPVCLGLQHRF